MSWIYLASSWRNVLQPEVLRQLQDAGNEVYDFRNPGPGKDGFRWSEIDPDWINWKPQSFAYLFDDAPDRRRRVRCRQGRA